MWGLSYFSYCVSLFLGVFLWKISILWINRLIFCWNMPKICLHSNRPRSSYKAYQGGIWKIRGIGIIFTQVFTWYFVSFLCFIQVLILLTFKGVVVHFRLSFIYYTLYINFYYSLSPLFSGLIELMPRRVRQQVFSVGLLLFKNTIFTRTSWILCIDWGHWTELVSRWVFAFSGDRA